MSTQIPAGPAGPAWLPGRFRLLKKLGAGGMGEVWLADDLQQGRQVAVKRLKLARGDGSGAAEADRLRFKREFLILSGLKSPGVVAVHDLVETVSDLCYTMEMVPGWPIREYLSGGHWRSGAQVDERRLPDEARDPVPAPRFFEEPGGLQRLWELAGELFTALAYLHAQSLVHRDLKPGNLMVNPEGRLKLIDFGLARAASDDLSVTRAGEVLGTPYYLSPEQIRALPLDGRADLYAVGVILYELSTGQVPFKGAGTADVVMAHLLAPPVPPRQLNSAITPAHNALILRLLAKKPEGRFPTALDCRQALLGCGSDPAGQLAATAALTTTHPLAPGESGPAAPQDLLIAPYIGNVSVCVAVLKSCAGLLAGNGAALFIGGAPGSGKSRLGDEVRAFAVEHGLRTFTGRGREEGGMAGQLFQDIFAGLREQLQHRPALAASWLAADGAVLGVHFPALRRILPGGSLSGPSVQPAPLAPEAERARLQAAVYNLFNRMCAQQSVALLFDDLHCADPLSLDLLAHLIVNFAGDGAQDGGRPPLLIIANFRQTGDSCPVLEGWLERMAGALSRHTLAPLSETELGRLCAALLGMDGNEESPPPARFTARLHELTGGNPFFLVETLKSLIATRQLQREPDPDGAVNWNFSEWLAQDRSQSISQISLPGTIQAALNRRLGELDAQSQEALRIAALIGREFQFGWWLNASGMAEDRLLEVADRAIRSRLLLEKPSEQLAFSHEQLRGALLSGLTTIRRRRLHARIVGVLENGGGDVPVELLAEHAIEGGVREPAITYGHRAVRKLLDLYSGAPALQLLDRIGGLLAGGEPMSPAARLQHALLHCRALELRGDTRMAADAANDAVDLARTLRNESAELELELLYSGTIRLSGDAPAAAAAAERALALATRLEDESAALHALIALGQAYRYINGSDAARRHFESVYARAQRFGDPAICAKVLNALGAVTLSRGDFLPAREYFIQAAALFERLGDAHNTAFSKSSLGAIAQSIGELAESERCLHAAQRTYRETGNLRGMAYTQYVLAACNINRGRFERARTSLEATLAMLGPLGHRYYDAYTRFYLALALQGLGQFDAAEAEIRRALEIFREITYAPGEANALLVAADIALSRGDLVQAESDAQAGLHLSTQHEAMDLRSFSMSVLALARSLRGAPPDHVAFRESLALAVECGCAEVEFSARQRYASVLIRTGNPAEALIVIGESETRARIAGYLPIADQLKALREKAMQ